MGTGATVLFFLFPESCIRIGCFVGVAVYDMVETSAASFVVRSSTHTDDTKTYRRLTGNNRVSNAAEGGGQNSTTEKQADCVWFFGNCLLFVLGRRWEEG